MEARVEPFLAERVWAHPTTLWSVDVTVTIERDEHERPVVARYSDGETETYRYDDQGRLIEIDEHPALWATVDAPAQRVDSGGRLHVEHDTHGPVRIRGSEGTVWERCTDPWPDLLRRGARSLADRCVASVAQSGMPSSTEVYCLVLTYVGDGGLNTMITAGTEDERRSALTGGDPVTIACDLWYPESPELSFAEIDMDPTLDDELLLREAALHDPREAQRTVLTEAAKLLARHDWHGLLTPTADFVVFIAEHDEGFTEKHASVLEVNPPERVAAWDAAWPPGVPRDDAD